MAIQDAMGVCHVHGTRYHNADLLVDVATSD